MSTCCVCGAEAYGGREHCPKCSPTFGPYDAILAIKSLEEVEAFVKTEVAKLTTFPWCMVALHPHEADRITRKNAVAFAHGVDTATGQWAETMFGVSNPLV